jgi:hypothetical protein
MLPDILNAVPIFINSICAKSWHPIIICIAEKASNDIESLINQFEVSLPENGVAVN